ncbi:MAG: hypothetical protein GXP18_02715 [Gammaproteobacteria bacterium]|nr:hypothetical protein [Gammaproteobacteria bacterium]
MLKPGFKKPVYFIFGLWVILLLPACKTTESTGLRDYSNGIHIAVAVSATNPAYTITETAGDAGSGYAYLLEKANGRWRVMYDSFDAKAFAKPVGSVREVPADTEVLWTDGINVAAYFSTEPLLFSKIDGSFACPKNKETSGHRACRSALTEAKSLFGGLGTESKNRPFVLDFDEIRRAVEDTGIVATAKRRLAAEK